jgi:hypothetical protein
MLKEIATAAACAILMLEAMITLQLYGLNAISGVLAGATVGTLGVIFARLRQRAFRNK